jgi:tetratricopeptide (TPR) repeat protein
VFRFWSWFILLTLLTAAVYSSVYRFDFVDYDDRDCFNTNPYIYLGLPTHAVRDAFRTTMMGNYAPLVSLSYCADQSLFHLRPGPMHVENVLLHWMAGMLLWRLLYLGTGQLDRSAIVAGLFLVAPMHVESVAWITERKDVLSTPLLLGTMICYVRFCKSVSHLHRACWYVGMMVLYALSLLSKSMGVTLPAVLLLMDVWPLGRWKHPGWNHHGWNHHGWITCVLEKLPLCAIAIAAAVGAAIAQQSAGAASTLTELGIIPRINNALVCYVIYIAKLAVPTNLAVFYQHPGNRPWPAVIASAGLLLLATYFFCRQRIRRPWLLIGWLWFLGTLVPVIGLVQVGSQAMADRYSYFPSIGLYIAAVWFIGDWVKNQRLQIGVAIVSLSIYAAVARQQVLYWRDTQTLFAHAIAVTDVNPVAHNILGRLDLQRGDVNAAFRHYHAALTPFANPRAYDGMGNCLLHSNIDQAILYYRQAVKFAPHVPEFQSHLDQALRMKNSTNQPN